jgi:hypothetical protein
MSAVVHPVGLESAQVEDARRDDLVAFIASRIQPGLELAPARALVKALDGARRRRRGLAVRRTTQVPA